MPCGDWKHLVALGCLWSNQSRSPCNSRRTGMVRRYCPSRKILAFLSPKPWSAYLEPRIGLGNIPESTNFNVSWPLWDAVWWQTLSKALMWQGHRTFIRWSHLEVVSNSNSLFNRIAFYLVLNWSLSCSLDSYSRNVKTMLLPCSTHLCTRVVRLYDSILSAI